MMTLKNHPFAVEAFFESSLVLTYAIPKEELKDLIPECLELDVFNDCWAFVAVAVVDTKNLRPKGFPKWMGDDFILLGYRVFVRYTDTRGRRLRGLYILKSETDKKKMAVLGNIFTHYKYTFTDIHFQKNGQMMSVISRQSVLNIAVDLKQELVALPEGSPFKDWKEARRFAGPLPFTFTYNSQTKEVLIIEGVRENWTPHAVRVVQNQIGFMKQKEFQKGILANAFLIEKIPYLWKKGKIEKWKK